MEVPMLLRLKKSAVPLLRLLPLRALLLRLLLRLRLPLRLRPLRLLRLRRPLALASMPSTLRCLVRF